jgi:hypothetical protein
MVATVNLIPIARRQIVTVRRHVRWWAWGCSGYAVVLLVALALAQFGWIDQDAAIAEELTAVRAEMGESRVALAELRQELDQAAVELRAATAVGRQPDWSVLLAHVARSLGEEIVLRRCRLDAFTPDTEQTAGSQGIRRTASAGASGLQAGDGVFVVLDGYGRTQQSVSDFLLRLERGETFEEVKLLDTRREPFLAGHAVTFRIQAELNTQPVDDQEQRP